MSPSAITEKKVTRLDNEEIARVKNIPLVEVKNQIVQSIEEEGIYVDPNTLVHFSTLTYDFSFRKDKRENFDLFEKLIKNLEPEFRDNRWAWCYFEDETHDLRISVQICETGRVIIPIPRGSSIKHYLQAISELFDFFTLDELTRFLTLLYLRKGKDARPYLHLANRITDDNDGETIRANLKHANIILRRINHLGKKETEVVIDESMGSGIFECEEKGKSPQSVRLNKLFATPQVLEGSIADIGDKIVDTRYNTYKLMGGQTLISNQIQNYHQDALAYISEVDMNNENRKLQQDWKLAAVESNVIREVKEVKHVYVEHNKQHGKTTEKLTNLSKNTKDLATNVGELIDTQIAVKDEIHDKIETENNRTNSLIIDTSNIIHDKIDKLDTKIEKRLDSLENSIQSILKQEFEEFGNRFKDNIQLVIRQLYKIPSRTAKEIALKLNKSKSSVYSYLKELRDRNLIKKHEIPTRKKGRPKGYYDLSEKLTNKIKNLNKKVK